MNLNDRLNVRVIVMSRNEAGTYRVLYYDRSKFLPTLRPSECKCSAVSLWQPVRYEVMWAVKLYTVKQKAPRPPHTHSTPCLYVDIQHQLINTDYVHISYLNIVIFILVNT